MDNAGKIATVISTAVITVFAIVLMSILVAWPIQWLWNNCLVGAIEGVNPIGFWQALGINILSTTLFNRSVTSKSKNNEEA